MLSNCPHCRKALSLNEAQQGKLQKALASLPEGKTLKIACPLCKQPIHLLADGSPAEGEAVMENVLYAEHPGGEDQALEKMVEKVREAPKPDKPPPAAPKPPDVSWLVAGEYKEQIVVKDVPLVMILMAAGDARTAVFSAFNDLGYQAEFPESVDAAIERLRFVKFAAVVLHTSFEGGGFKDSAFHEYMRQLPMAGRRSLYYVLVGPEFHTFYDLEALSYSANLVVHDNDVAHMPVILKKGRRDYEELFGPYLEALKEHGRK